MSIQTQPHMSFNAVLYKEMKNEIFKTFIL